MLLKNIIKNMGDYCFDNRGLQFLPYLLVILVELEDFRNVTESVPFEIACFAITLTGIIIRILTIGFVPENTSGRNRGKQIADTLNTKGMYSIVRNPLYVGNFFIFLGITIMSQSWEIIIANSLLMLIIYTLIVLREEEFLLNKFGETYKNWAEKVNCFVPSLKNFEKPDRKFSVKKVFKNEHDTWLTTIIAFVGIEIVRGFYEVQTFFLIPLWIYTFAAVLFIWGVTKYLKKTGRLKIKKV